MRTSLTPFDPDAISAQPAAAPESMIAPTPTANNLMLADVLATLPEAKPEPAAMPGLARLLNRREKWQLSELAEATFNSLKKRGLIDAGEKLEAFRQRIANAACGRRISQATAGDRMLIQAALLKLKGEAAEAARATVKAATTAADIARHQTRQTCLKRQYPLSYLEGISARIYKRPFASLSAKEVWTIHHTLVNNANARDGKGKAENRFKKLKAQRRSQTKSL